MSVTPVIRHIYQIGNVPIHAHVNAYTQMSYTGRGKSEDLQDSYRVLLVSAPRRVEPRTERYSLTLYNNGMWSEAQTVQRLLTISNQHVDVIAYELVGTNGQAVDDSLKCACAVCECCPCEMLWLHNVGRMTRLEVTGDDNDAITLSLEVEFGSYWKPVNRMLWDWRSDGASSIYGREFSNSRLEAIAQYPTCDDVFSYKRCRMFYKTQYNDTSFLYDPFWLTELHCNHRPDYPDTGHVTNWNKEDTKTFVNIEPHRWSAPPISLYLFKGFKNLTTTSKLTITRQEVFRTLNELVTIDWSVVNAIADDEDISIAPKRDIFVLGDVRSFAYVMRGNDILFYASSAVTYNGLGDFPGMLSPGTNIVFAEPKKAVLAQHHYYRRL